MCSYNPAGITALSLIFLASIVVNFNYHLVNFFKLYLFKFSLIYIIFRLIAP